jgi:hypothetical protein
MSGRTIDGEAEVGMVDCQRRKRVSKLGEIDVRFRFDQKVDRRRKLVYAEWSIHPLFGECPFGFWIVAGSASG